ncbi:hypothetical protein [Phage Phass-1]|uniref:Uncharacterized protein n=1 Tax=Phage Phass-1 TaxID=3043662 RepID=A0AAF0RTJ8_9CAUD|nr:hypothetical protein [Phage Phass-1]
MGMHKKNNEAVSEIREQMWRLARHNQIIEDEIYRMVIDAMAAFDDFLFPGQILSIVRQRIQSMEAATEYKENMTAAADSLSTREVAANLRLLGIVHPCGDGFEVLSWDSLKYLSSNYGWQMKQSRHISIQGARAKGLRVVPKNFGKEEITVEKNGIPFTVKVDKIGYKLVDTSKTFLRGE